MLEREAASETRESRRACASFEDLRAEGARLQQASMQETEAQNWFLNQKFCRLCELHHQEYDTRESIMDQFRFAKLPIFYQKKYNLKLFSLNKSNKGYQFFSMLLY